MGKLIPNENCWIGFIPDTYSGTPSVRHPGVANLSAPTKAEIDGAVDLTGLNVSLTASATGNTVPTPALDSRFETSIDGTVTAQFTADFYRDDEGDLAWVTLPRTTKGTFIISRFGGSSSTVKGMPDTGDVVEVYPVEVTTRAAAALASNTAETFSLTCAVPVEPVEHAIVAA